MCDVRCSLQHLAHADYDALYAPFSPNAPASQGFRGGIIVQYFPNTNTAVVVVAVESDLA